MTLQNFKKLLDEFENLQETLAEFDLQLGLVSKYDKLVKQNRILKENILNAFKEGITDNK